MPFGRGCSGWRGACIEGNVGFGRGMGRGMGLGHGMVSGMGRGNPYPFCRFDPSLPRRWWADRADYYQTVQPGVFGRRRYYNPSVPYSW